MISILFILFRFILWPNAWPGLGHAPWHLRRMRDSAVAWFGWWVEHLVVVCVVWLLFHAAQVCFPVNLLLWKVGR